MTENMILSLIKKYEGNVERNRRYAEYYNAEFEQTGSHNAYFISRNFYSEAEHCRTIIERYREMIRNGEFNPQSEVYGH